MVLRNIGKTSVTPHPPGSLQLASCRNWKQI